MLGGAEYTEEIQEMEEIAVENVEDVEDVEAISILRPSGMPWLEKAKIPIVEKRKNI